MTNYIDEKYIRLLAPKLKLFKQKGPHLFNFRCPVCGDSKKNSTKTRGFIYERKGNYSFYCQNCGSPMRLDKFIKYMDTYLHTEYMFEKFAQEPKPEEDASRYITHPVFDHTKRTLVKDHLVSIDSLSKDFHARKYLEGRKVPIEGLYYTSDFSEYVRSQFPDQDKHLRKEPRIVIPFFDNKGELLGVQGRAVGQSNIRYITIKYPDSPKIFGWNKVDLTKTVYVVEGPIDSLMLHNGIATMDGSLYNITSVLGVDVDYVFVYDAERRNKQIVNNMRKTIDLGYRVCIWPDDFTFKDINEAVVDGMLPAVVQNTIDKNTFSGIEAMMRLNIWARV